MTVGAFLRGDIITFADDSVSLLTDSDGIHELVVDHFIQWCDTSFLNTDAFKTKEIY